MDNRLNLNAVVAWLYVMETLDTCIESRINGAFVQLVFDLINAYPDERNVVLTIRDAHRLMGVKHD
jgi:hypothetical protein